jgi:hypothetical protein
MKIFVYLKSVSGFVVKFIVCVCMVVRSCSECVCMVLRSVLRVCVWCYVRVLSVCVWCYVVY